MKKEIKSTIPMDGLFHHNGERHRWERVDSIQEYKGCVIELITHHRDWVLTVPQNHREYKITFPDGHSSFFGSLKRGGDLKSLKEYIDLKAKHNELLRGK